MLHRSFKAGKCKTSLKLAVARIKLLKNKREAQLKQMKKELAQLLESGQERTARIRVEHVVREEKTITAYDLIEIYCELIAARLPIIESQKNCPIDLKEAVASVVFASPRCSDIPELSDVRKHVTAKYGKEFIASALELRPECGVNRMMVEKLSAIAPDGETKIKLLTLIAQEHNIKWDPKEFAEKESKPPEDLLNGPRISEAASNAPAANPTVQLPHRHDPKYESSVNSETKVAESARSSQTFEHTDSTMRTSHPEPRSSVYAAEGRASVTSSSKEESSFSLNRQNWGMEFKDAASAAQAAAESAERASIAARAAAELSSIGRIRQQNSMGSQESFGNSYSDDGIKKSRGPMSKTEHIEHSVKMDDLLRTSSHGMDSRMQDDRRHRNGKENLAGASASSFDVDSITDRRDSRSTQLGSKISFPDDDIMLNNLPKADVYSQRSTFEVDATNSNWQTDKTEKDDFLGEVCTEKQSSEFVGESQDLQQNRQRIEHNSSGKVGISKPHDRSGSISDGSASDDDVMLDSELRMNGSSVSGHSSSIGQGNVQIGAKQPSFSNYAAAVFDDSGSDDDCNLAAESVFSRHEFDFYEPSEDRKSLSHISEHSGSPKRQGSASLGNSSMQSRFAMEPRSPFGYAESTKEAAVPSRLSVISATFDDSDGLYSDSDEEDANNAKLGGTTNISSLPLEHTPLTRSPESLQTDGVQGPIKYTSKKTEATESYQKPRLHSSSDYLESYDVHSESNLEAKPNVGGPAQEKQEHLESSSLSRLSLAEEVKATDDFRYTVSSKDSPVVEEKRQPLSQLSFTKELKLKDDVNAQGVPDNMEDSYISQTLSSESGQGLNFGRLSGGFRNKGYIRPPYNKGPSSDASFQSREKSDGGTSAIKEKPTSRSVLGTSVNSEALYREPYNQKQVEVQRETSSRTPKTIFDSPSDNESEAASPYQTSMNSGALYPEPYNQKKQVEVHHEASSRTPKKRIDSDSDNKTEVVSPYQTVGNSGYSRRGLSQRNRDSPKQSQANSLPRFSSGSQVQASSERRKPSTSASYDTKSVSGPPNEKARYESSGESSLRSRTSEEHSEAQNQVRNTQNSMLSTADTSVPQKTNKAQTQNKVQVYDEGSKLSQPSSIVKEPSLLHSSAASRETITPKSPSLSKALGSRENSLNKASHVHPKLPDYDSFAAHFESLRSNRRSG